MKPVARLNVTTDETISVKVGHPAIKFHRANNTKSVISITLGFENIADLVEDSDADVDDETRENFRDALIDSKDFFVPGNVKVKFEKDGADGAKMTIEAFLPTKVPGTGPELHLNGDHSKQKQQ